MNTKLDRINKRVDAAIRAQWEELTRLYPSNEQVEFRLPSKKNTQVGRVAGCTGSVHGGLVTVYVDSKRITKRTYHNVHPSRISFVGKRGAA